MATMQYELVPKASLWPEYRRAFQEFYQRVRQIQSLMSLNSDPDKMNAASAELERARAAYNCRRDALTQQLLSASRR